MQAEVIIRHAGDKPISVIKEIRAVTGCSLAEAKDLAMATPSTLVLEDGQAQQFVEAMRNAGAVVEFAPPPQAAAPAPAPDTAGDLVGQLERLSALKTSGAITAEEYEQLKYRLLAGT